jgi:hypothetical protein
MFKYKNKWLVKKNYENAQNIKKSLFENTFFSKNSFENSLIYQDNCLYAAQSKNIKKKKASKAL